MYSLCCKICNVNPSGQNVPQKCLPYYLRSRTPSITPHIFLTVHRSSLCWLLRSVAQYWNRKVSTGTNTEAFSGALEQTCMHSMQLLHLDSTRPMFSSANGSFLSIPGIHSSGHPVVTLVDPLPDKSQVCVNTPAINISLARVHFCPFTAGVALDVATPKKLAVALPHTRVLVCVISSAAAHEVAAVGLLRSLVADPALCSHATRHRICLTIVGRLLNVHQISFHGLPVRVRLFNLQKGRSLVPTGSDRFYMHGVVILLLEDVTQLSELWESGPASLGGAGSRYTVTFTL